MKFPGILLAAAAMATTIPAHARLGNYPDFSLMEKADTVALFSREDLQVTKEAQPFLPATRCWIALPRFLREGTGKSLSYLSEELRMPESAITFLVFLSKTENGVVPINWMCSTVPSSSAIEDLSTTTSDCWDIVAAMFAREASSDCALHQARLLATAPQEYARRGKASLDVADDRLWLARFLVALTADGVTVLADPSAEIRDIASIGVRDNSVEPLSSNVRSSVATWVRRKVTPENASDILDFVLTQHGRFQGEMLTGIARCVPVGRLPEVAALMKRSRHNLVRYGCFQIICHRLNNGKGICGVDDFSRNPARYIDRAEAFLTANGVGGIKKG